MNGAGVGVPRATMTVRRGVTDRERYLTVLFNGPILPADVIVVLAGEDADARVATGAGAMLSGGGKLLMLSGGRHEPPRIVGAEALVAKAMGKGVSPDHIKLDAVSRNTREQAVAFAAAAEAEKWSRALLVASAYHMPRAFLTFVQAMDEAGVADRVCIHPLPVSHTPWSGTPAGADVSRVDLLEDELRKVDDYGAEGHVATYARGVEYLLSWEREPEVRP